MQALAEELGVEFHVVHKKIALSEPRLAWEHEQFAMNKLPGFTLSTLDSPKSTARASILDVRLVVSELAE